MVRVKLVKAQQWLPMYGVDLGGLTGTMLHIDFDMNGRKDPMVLVFLDRPLWMLGRSYFASHVWAPMSLCYAESADYEGCLNER